MEEQTLGKVEWECPSNIAIVKYWGKFGNQLPRNTSISFTLSTAKTITSVEWTEKKTNINDILIDFYFEGNKNQAFGSKSEKFLQLILDDFPWLTKYKITIQTQNTFPHSAGIASSASGMSALAMCIMDLDSQISGNIIDSDLFMQKASYYARLGSGSACRSIFPKAALWGRHEEIAYSSNEYAIGLEHVIHPVFADYHDDILIVSKKEKSVSSSAGHKLMDGNPYATTRYLQAQQHSVELMHALKTGDLEKFGEILELEAMTLHALMMASSPSFILMEPQTLVIIDQIKALRREKAIPVYFTLDAGPNIHLLYPESVSKEVNDFLALSQIPEFQIIRDMVGQGCKKVL